MWRIKTVSSQAEAIVNINASSLENITGEKLIGKTVDTEIAGIFKDAYKDLGYDINIIFSDPKNSPQLKDEDGNPKTGTAYVRDENGKKIKTIIINGKDPKNATKAGLIGTIVEEGSHVIGKIEGRQRKTGTDEKGLESTGRASNEYFAEKYKDDNTPISIHSDGKDYSNVDFGENVGDNNTALFYAGGAAAFDGPLPIGDIIALGILGVLGISKIIKYKEHDKINKEKDTLNKHEKGNARRQRDQGGEKKKQNSNWTPRGGKKKWWKNFFIIKDNKR